MAERRRRRRAPALTAAAAAAVALIVLTPVAAGAHALLVSSSPRPGDSLGTAPGAVVLEFSEALNPRLSSASATDPGGHRWPGTVTTGPEMRISLVSNLTGVYTVEWTSVSATDGHRTAGSYKFGVRVALTAPLSDVAATGDPHPSDVLVGLAGWVEALALLLLTGEQLLLLLARRPPPLPWVRGRFLSASAALSAGLVVVWAEATLASGGHSISAFLGYFGSGPTEAARLLRIGCEALALIAVIRGWRSLPVWTIAALAALAASGHAADVQPRWWGIGLDSVHLLAAACWAGGIAALAIQRPPDGWRADQGRRLLARFTPVALTAFTVTVIAGALQAAAQLGSLAALVATAYGRVLLAKIGLVGLMLPLSLLAWRWRRPRLRLEAGLAVGVVAAAALLAAFPAPPSQAARRAAALAAGPVTAGLPKAGDVTLGGSAGSVLVGLTLSPGMPGRNRVTAYLLPVQGPAQAAGLVANVSVGGVVRPLLTCAQSCRSATVELRGGEHLDVDVLGPLGGRAGFEVPPLPAPHGEALFARLQTAMHTLRSYEVTETLSSGRATVRSAYASQAPDRLRLTVFGAGAAAESQTVWIGTTQYTDDAPGGGWQAQRGLPAAAVPSFVWDYFQPLSNVRVVGTQSVDGVPTTELAGFGSRQATAIWFTFWIDAEGLVRQAEMHAPGHFMTDRYGGFDSPQNITAPAGAG